MLATHLWFFSAVLASILWGIGYAVSGKILEGQIQPSFLLLFSALIALPCYFLMSYFSGGLKTGIEAISNTKNLWLGLSVCATTTIIGNFLIYFSISAKNATLASLIEISYPFFTLAFAWLLFREIHLNWATALGAVLVFSGIVIIFLKS